MESDNGIGTALQEAPRAAAQAEGAPRHPFLVALGERVRTLRARRGLTRKAVAQAADVSERHLANLEYGTGNASILVLLQVAQALHCELSELLGDVTTSSPEWLMIRELLEHRDEADLRRARHRRGRGHRGCARHFRGTGGRDQPPAQIRAHPAIPEGVRQRRADRGACASRHRRGLTATSRRQARSRGTGPSVSAR